MATKRKVDQLSDKDIAKIVSLYAAGVDRRLLAERFRVNPPRIDQVVREARRESGND